MAAMASNYCCYFDHRYLPRGVAMIRSLKRWDPAAVVWVLCLSDECFQALSELEERGVNLVRIDDLETAYPALGEARRNRTTIEFYFTCTPSLVRFVLRQAGEGAVVTYVDGDLYFFSDPEPLFAELGHNSVSIIPHRFPPRLRHLEKFGLYNVGWMSFRNDPRGQAVASWWQDRCNEWCYDILDGDRFADQKYLDRIATEFDGVVVLSHRGANLAPWNLGGHRLTLRNNGVVVDGQWPLIFFHFHGLKRVGNGLYMPDHFRYHAPFIGLIRGRIYRPYIQVLEAIVRETAPYFVAPATTLARYASKGMGLGERVAGRLKKPAKYALAMVTGEFIVVRRASGKGFAADRGDGSAPVRAKRPDGARTKLRVIVVHNYYGSSAPSGENNAVNAEIAMLRRYDHEVHPFTRESDEIRDDKLRGLMHGGLTFPWNPLEVSRLKKFMHAVKPDVVHVHNTFPLISPGIFWVIRDCAASVLTMHNYRLFCSSALLLRDGAVCTRCLDESSVMPALRYGCYRQSRIATLPVAHSIALHRSIGTWRSRVDAFIALTEFQRDKLIAAGLPAERVHVKSNFFAGNPSVMAWGERRKAALFVGRLTAEKGVELLIRAWLELGSAPPLRIVGDGPLRASLEALAKSRGPADIEFLGAVAPQAAVREVAEAKLLFVPSIWFEGFPIVLQEAFAAGTPCAVSDMGALPILVKDGTNGLVFEARSAEAIAALVRRVWTDDALLARISAGARASFEANYTEEINYRRLIEIYANALARRQQVLGGALRVASAPPG
jgi:glycosyltransferase involved in cell wall biosynthesis